MAKGRTVSANLLSDKDKKIINLCKQISDALLTEISDKETRQEFKDKYAKISKTRDGGSGLGGGKLQRDALCTRGKQGKAPFSNRNLRWHPLIVAESKPKNCKEIQKIEIIGETVNKKFLFTVVDKDGIEIKIDSENVHELEERYVILPKHWNEHVEELESWDDSLWTKNSCVIPAYETSEWYDSMEAYAVLGLAVGKEQFNIENTYNSIQEILEKQEVEENIQLPTPNFPSYEDEVFVCPLCKSPLNENVANLPERNREKTFQPKWRTTKRDEGNDNSIQLLHTLPLIESEYRHNAKNVRYGHRWRNVAMTDHSIPETLQFMKNIIKVHEK